MINVEIIDDEIRKLLRELPEKAGREIGKALDSIGDDIRTAWVKGITNNSGKSGVIYKKKHKGGGVYFHQASAKGQYPASDSGNLSNRTIKKKESDSLVTVTNDAAYAGYLEENLERSGSEKAIEQAEPNFNKYLDAAVTRALA